MSCGSGDLPPDFSPDSLSIIPEKRSFDLNFPSEDRVFAGGSTYEMEALSTAFLVLPRKKDEIPEVK